ncbi:hypothetical protein [Mycoavidus cysteinexigens]|uniref:hypothetical protein n=1 Tax=Mycoavidus cysteinexigens TaxID=1553431 RepID=UPI001375FE4D|nr:hypothetical protein [Mycoavidus cysteinexigens]GAM53584.1 hypothetical protein EBME_2047 [bacterium endosymbiont of Mortierella elongata FMR23-6]
MEPDLNARAGLSSLHVSPLQILRVCGNGVQIGAFSIVGVATARVAAVLET